MERNLPHIKMLQPPVTEKFTSIGSGGRDPIFPSRNRNSHGQQIKQKLNQVWEESEDEIPEKGRNPY